MSGGYVYWSDSCLNTIERSSTDGTERTTIYKQYATLISADDRYLYLIRSPSVLLAIPISGGAETFISDASVNGAATTADTIYWAEGTGLYRAPKLK